ncbi:TPA: hypothetical protein NKQ48_004813 [Vibrio parahaemolyticus]|uniref:hypothetical protein n=1 Tax=Vibrio TaxID=662 RepID=UPI000673D245|nr:MULTISPECIES: hypothetical protein [Vibrio]EGR0495230.1 hypothetical protein [Vibrio cholerae]EIZ0685688.1 hypothetical protein [Vibrio parahaemolyticus]KNA50128.1 hypothetical protein A51_021312 [Vibrio cholerae MZO-3]MBE5187100.1 hypothetical protein [Vibrio parahaemolyticus]MBE5200920.1 hypothetical protein [Vibrio parahaemolyticus]
MVLEYVSGIKAAWDAAKSVKAVTDSFDDAHLKLQMAELMSALADAKVEAAVNAEKIDELERLLNTKNTMKFIDGKYYKSTDDELEGPFCATCYDYESKEIRLQSTPDKVGGDWHCRVCNGWYKDRT